MEFGQLLDLEDVTDRASAIRRTFAPFTSLVDVTGYEELTLIVLVNLSLRRLDVDDLLDKRLAVKTLKDEKHVGACLSEVRWLHTHNLKYPDTRVAGQRLIATLPSLIPGVVSSAGMPSLLGWSHNSKVVNKAKLFGSAFTWNENVCNLAQLIAEQNPVWRKTLMTLGVRAKQLKCWSKQLAQLMSQSNMPSAVSDYSPQLRFPYRGSYISVTPVASHAVLCELQQLRAEQRGHFEMVKHDHSASVGDLPASLGGYISALNYPPPVWTSSKHTLHQSRVNQVRQGKDVLDVGAIRSHDFLNALERLIRSDESLTHKEKRRSRVASLRVIRKKLADWLAPILEWRDAYQEGEQDVDELAEDDLAYQIIHADMAVFPSFMAPLNQQLHRQMQGHHKASKYAYHPQLLDPLQKQIRAVLNTLAKRPVGQGNVISKVQYIHLEGLRAFDARSLANPYLNGIPSLTALWGLVHNFERRINKLLEIEFRFSGVAWFIRSYSRVPGKKLPEPAIPGRDGKSISRPGIIDSKYCDLVMDVVVRVVTDDGDALSERDLSFIQAAFPSTFAGGCLHPPSLYENREWCRLYSAPECVFTKLARLPNNGCWVYPMESDCRSLNDLLDKTVLDPYVKPVMLGYGLLGDVVPRGGSIEPTHAFAEPLIGLARCVSAVGARLNGADAFYGNAFWGLGVGERTMLMGKA